MFRLSSLWFTLALSALDSAPVAYVDAASNDLMLDNVAIIPVDGTQTPGNGWSDSYSEGDKCYCDSSNYDHGIGTVIVSTPCGDMTVIEACDLIATTKPAGSSSAGRPVYNDIQCGNGPLNNAGDEDMVRCCVFSTLPLRTAVGVPNTYLAISHIHSNLQGWPTILAHLTISDSTLIATGQMPW